MRPIHFVVSGDKTRADLRTHAARDAVRRLLQRTSPTRTSSIVAHGSTAPVTYQRKDAHYRRAKAEGFRARSAYKLAELRRPPSSCFARATASSILAHGPVAGCQVALDARRTERSPGRDRPRTDPALLARRRRPLVVGDVRRRRTCPEADRTISWAGSPDVVLSDVAPKLTGVRDVDDARCAESVRRRCIVALPGLLRSPADARLVKLFMDRELPRASPSAAKRCFADVDVDPARTRRAADRPSSTVVRAAVFRPAPRRLWISAVSLWTSRGRRPRPAARAAPIGRHATRVKYRDSDE